MQGTSPAPRLSLPLHLQFCVMSCSLLRRPASLCQGHLMGKRCHLLPGSWLGYCLVVVLLRDWAARKAVAIGRTIWKPGPSVPCLENSLPVTTRSNHVETSSAVAFRAFITRCDRRLRWFRSILITPKEPVPVSSTAPPLLPALAPTALLPVSGFASCVETGSPDTWSFVSGSCHSASCVPSRAPPCAPTTSHVPSQPLQDARSRVWREEPEGSAVTPRGLRTACSAFPGSVDRCSSPCAAPASCGDGTLFAEVAFENYSHLTISGCRGPHSLPATALVFVLFISLLGSGGAGETFPIAGSMRPSGVQESCHRLPLVSRNPKEPTSVEGGCGSQWGSGEAHRGGLGRPRLRCRASHAASGFLWEGARWLHPHVHQYRPPCWESRTPQPLTPRAHSRWVFF